MNELEELAARYPYTLDTIIDLHKCIGYTCTEELVSYAHTKAYDEKELKTILRCIRIAYLKGYIGSVKNLAIDVRKT